MNTKTVNRAQNIAATLTVPGDKSISHRVAMLAAISRGTSEIRGFLASEDCLNTLKAMQALGAEIKHDGDIIRITGTGGTLHKPAEVLDMGNSGTGMRLLAGLLAGQPFETEMTGDASLRSRPMGRISNPLIEMGAEIELLGEGGCAPIRIRGGSVKPVSYELPMASAQVKSAVLLAGLSAVGTTTVIEPRATRNHTELMLKAMGADISVDGLTITLRSRGLDGSPLKSGSWRIPGDFSSAAFWITAAASREGGTAVIKNVGLNPRRTALLDVLRRMGAKIEIELNSDSWEPAGTITIHGARLKATEVGGDEIPNLIDELPLVAVAGALARGTTVIRDAAELRVKESDRIAAMAANLGAAGVTVAETDDGMRITGGEVKGGCSVESYGDHRIAMAMAILALSADKPIQINNIACIATSYPEFWEDMDKIIMKNRVIAIDGPSASGKSTVARKVAARLDWLYVDSGALYRAVTWKALREGLDTKEGEKVAGLAQKINPEFSVKSGAVCFLLDGIALDRELRTEEINRNVSPVAAQPTVRALVTQWLRDMLKLGNLVMEGRDIGTAVFKDSKLKFYLDASPEERARRRHAEMEAIQAMSVKDVRESLSRRDEIDSRRMTAPLHVADDANVIDSTGMSADEVATLIIEKSEIRKNS